MSSEKIQSASGATQITGIARVDSRVRNITARMEPGDIAVIDQVDLDRQSAHALVSREPKAVLNAAPSSSGRQQVRGPRVLLEAGIIVIDDLGPDVMSLREGDTITIEGGRVLRDDEVVSTGRLLSLCDLENDEVESRQLISTQIGSFAASIEEFLDRDGDVLRGVGVPTFKKDLEGKPVVVVLDDSQTKQQLKNLKRWIGDASPIIIGVDGGSDLARSAGFKPQIVVGDMDQIGDKVLRGAGRRILRRGHDGIAQGSERLNRMGLHADVVEMSGSSEDVALLVAKHSGASSIILVGDHHDLDDFIDRGRSAMSPSFFTRLVAGDELVQARAVAATHRPRLSGFWIVLLALVMIGGIGVALWATPWGNDLFSSIISLASPSTPMSPDSLTNLN